jgi:hypothetical protein
MWMLYGYELCELDCAWFFAAMLPFLASILSFLVSVLHTIDGPLFVLFVL